MNNYMTYKPKIRLIGIVLLQFAGKWCSTMKLFYRSIYSVLLSLLLLFPICVRVSAIDICEYRTNDDNIEIYCVDCSSTDVSVSISGKEADDTNAKSIDDEVKIETAFIIDTSKSIGAYETVIKDFLHEAVSNKKDNEYFWIGYFNGKKPSYLVDDENDRYEIDSVIDKIKFDGSASYIYDNLSDTVQMLENNDNSAFKRIIIITDGQENSQSGITLDEVKDDIERRGVQIFTVTLINSDRSNLEELKRIASLARLSGGNEIQFTSSRVNGKTGAKYLSETLVGITRVVVYPSADVADGGIRAVAVKSAGGSTRLDMRMPITGKDEKTTTSNTVVATSEATDIQTTDSNAGQETEQSSNILFFVLIGIAAVGIIIAIILLLKPEKPSKPNVASRDSALGDMSENKTVFIGEDKEDNKTTFLDDNRSGSVTVGLFSNPITVKLQDTNRPGFVLMKGMYKKDEWVIGRSINSGANGIIDNDDGVGRIHCKIYVDDSENVIVQDLNSTNHTFVNDMNNYITEPRILETGDVIKIGRTKLKVTINR